MKKEDLTRGVRTSQLVGMPIYTLEQGKKVGSVKDVVYDGQHDKLVALTIEEPGIISPERRILLFDRISSIGRDVVMIESTEVLIPEKEAREISRLVDQKSKITDKQVITQSGNKLGSISDIVIDEKTGQAISYEVTRGIAKDIGGGRNYVEAPKTAVIGDDAVIVPDEVETTFEEQEPGGLAGAYGTAMGKTREYGGRVVEYTREQEIRMVRDKTAGRDVRDDAGMLIVSTDQQITDEVIDHADRSGKLHQLALAAGVGGAAAGYESARDRAYGATGDRLKGRQVHRDIRDDRGEVVVHRGTIITDETLARAREEGVMGRLTSAVIGEESRGQAESFWQGAKDRASEAWAGIAESSREAANKAGRRRAESAQKEFLRGKISATEVRDDLGNIILHEDEVIAPLVLDTLDRAGKLEYVKIKPVGGAAEFAEEEEEPEIHVVVESREQHEQH